MSKSRKRSRQIHSDDEENEDTNEQPQQPLRTSVRATRNRSIPSYAESESDPMSENESKTGKSKSMFFFSFSPTIF